jgi:hypothetical protein
VGIAETGEREVLAFSVGDRENEQAWKDLLEDLKQRGVKAIDLWKSRWQSGHEECHHEEVPGLRSSPLCGSQDGQCAELGAKPPAGAAQTRTEGLVLVIWIGTRLIRPWPL